MPNKLNDIKERVKKLPDDKEAWNRAKQAREAAWAKARDKIVSDLSPCYSPTPEDVFYLGYLAGQKLLVTEHDEAVRRLEELAEKLNDWYDQCSIGLVTSHDCSAVYALANIYGEIETYQEQMSGDGGGGGE
jgi:hypothetical protein